MTLRRASIAVVVATLVCCGGRVEIDPTPGASGGGPADAGPDALPKSFLANGGETLYSVRPPMGDAGPELAVIEVITTFEGCEDVTDLAMSSAGKLYATTKTGLYTVDRSDGTCTLVAMGAYPDSLAFVPPGAADPVEEALVGYMGDSYVRIDPSTGAITTIGPLGANLVPSGDLAADPLGNVFLSVKGESCDACLVRIDPMTGAFAEMIHVFHDPDVSGLAYAYGGLYGVGKSGGVHWFDTATKAGTIAKGFPTKTPSGSLELWGATAEP